MPNPRKIADRFLPVRQFGRWRFQNATGKNVVITFSDTMALYVHSGVTRDRVVHQFQPDHSVII
jgi:hypothetical protein